MLLVTLLFPPILFYITDYLLSNNQFLLRYKAARYFSQHPEYYLSILSILVSIGVACSIYRLQRKQEEMEKKRINNHIKGALFNTLLLGIKQVHNYAKSNQFDEQMKTFKTVRILERHYLMLVELTNVYISQEESELLYFLLNDLETINNYENEAALFKVYEASDNLAKRIFIPAYFHFIKQTGTPKYLIPFLKKPYRNIFKKSLNQYQKDLYIDENNNLILKKCHNDYWKVFDPHKNLLAHAMIDQSGIFKGKGCVENFYKSTIYNGEWENYLPNGNGELFKINHDKKVLLKKGQWKKGEFVEGVMLQVIHKVFIPGDYLPSFALDTMYDFEEYHNSSILIPADLYTAAYVESKNNKFIVKKHVKTSLTNRWSDKPYVRIEQSNGLLLPFPSIDSDKKIDEKYKILQSNHPEYIQKFEDLLVQQREEVVAYYKQLLIYQYLKNVAPKFSFNFRSSDEDKTIVPLEVKLKFPKELIIMKTKDIKHKKPDPEIFKNLPGTISEKPSRLFERIPSFTPDQQLIYPPIDETIQIEENILTIEYTSIFEEEEKMTSLQFVILPLKTGTFYVKVKYLLPDEMTDFIKIEVIPS